ncbi:flagellar hook-associated protein FlgK [Alicyclobacillus fodiniaquatilis]|uniref:Flagellar hook-associated protein 1 n=1 Tax=Alicyclobacillus fodiniaquatilis TaxID=1661150 RepID=A0ABW4JSQ4_9BACL
MSIGTYFGLNVAVNAMNTAQEAEAVISNNIANSSTQGYTTETANIVESDPMTDLPSGQLGQGSSVESVTRSVNDFYNQQVNVSTSSYNAQNSLMTNLDQIQTIMNATSSTSLQGSIDDFFTAFQTLSTEPQNSAAGQSAIEQAQNLSSSFSTVQNQLLSTISNLNSVVSGSANGSEVSTVNQYATQLNQLNQQISNITSTGQNANQLLDQRDELLNNLSQLGNIKYSENSDGSVSVIFGTTNIVNTSGGFSTTTFTAADTSGVTSGSIYGNMQGISAAQNVIQTLGSLQSAIADGVNSQLELGYQNNSSMQGVPLFNVTSSNVTDGSTTTPVTSLSVTNITSDQLAVAQNASAPGDGSNASAIAALQNSTSLTDSNGNPLNSTPDIYYATLITNIGSQASTAQSNQQTADAILQQNQSMQESVSSVNVDDQMAQMVEFQNAYSAAAKIINTQNEMLQTLIQEA